MCESNVFLKKDDELVPLMENVALIRPEGSELVLKDILGEQKTVKAKLVEINLIDHKIILEET